MDNWTDQFGQLLDEGVNAVAVDASGIYVAGSVNELAGHQSFGRIDAFVRKYNFDGTVAWTQPFGTPDDDVANSIAVDSSGVYVAGWTSGSLTGQGNAGVQDVFVRKYDLTGNNIIWQDQFGTSGYDSAAAIAVRESFDIIVVGYVAGQLPNQNYSGGIDAFVRRYPTGGPDVTNWTNQFGTSDTDQALGVAIDASGIYVGGSTFGQLTGAQSNFGQKDAFVRKYFLDGLHDWTDQFGTPGDEEINGLAIYADGIYAVGWTKGGNLGTVQPGLNLPGTEGILRKYRTTGSVDWTRQLGSLDIDEAHGIAADASGVYVGGWTNGAMATGKQGGRDAFVFKYDFSSAPVWGIQFGSRADDIATGIALIGAV